MKIKLLIPLTLLALAGCGERVALTPNTGGALPVKPAMAAKQPVAADLTTATTQARPERSDEQLNRTERERQDDKFDLPPGA
ncbi:MAG: hypothetical protein ACKVOJ_07905 [Sphingomonadaceae bacterium]